MKERADGEVWNGVAAAASKKTGEPQGEAPGKDKL
jgi:hypothetical protein